MENQEPKKEKTFYKKWWFWIIVLLAIIIVCFTAIIVVALMEVTNSVDELAIEVQKIYPDATVYTSAGEKTLTIELRNYNDEYNSDDVKEIIQVVKDKINKEELSSYTSFVTLTYLYSNEKDEVLFERIEYSLPDWTQIEDGTKSYISYEEYLNLFNNYTDLFNSIF